MSGSPDPSPALRPADAAGVRAHLMPLLNQVEALRQDALARRNRAATAAAITGLILSGFGLLTLLGQGNTSPFGLFLIPIGIVAAFVLYHFTGGKAAAEYRKRFKTTVFHHALQQIAPQVRFLPDRHVNKTDFQRSGLFRSRIDSYAGEDCLHGRIGDTDILLSELHVQRKESSGSGENRRTHWVTVFQGIYLIADFHKHVRGHVMIVPDVAEATFGWLGRKMQSLDSNLVRLESPEFERAFKVTSRDPVEARYLLTPDMQERLLALRRDWQGDFRAALLDSTLHLALSKRNDWFEPDIRRPADDPAVLDLFLRQASLLLSIPTRLDLDTRLWEKPPPEPL